MSESFSNVSDDDIREFHHKISANVRRLRKERGFSQMDLALEIGIKSIAFFSNCESNRYNKHFNVEHLYKISKALNVTMIEFFE
jgi:transcriptional regulator with XRE-family HTH domain